MFLKKKKNPQKLVNVVAKGSIRSTRWRPATVVWIKRVLIFLNLNQWIFFQTATFCGQWVCCLKQIILGFLNHTEINIFQASWTFWRVCMAEIIPFQHPTIDGRGLNRYVLILFSKESTYVVRHVISLCILVLMVSYFPKYVNAKIDCNILCDTK